MTARPLIVPGAMPSRDANGRALRGLLRFFAPGTSTLKSVYSASDLVTALSQPIASDAAGRWPAMWAADTETFDAAWSDATFDQAIKTFANVSPANDAVLASVAMAQGAADAALLAQVAAEAARAATVAVAADLGDFDSAVTAAQAAQTAAAASAEAAAASAVAAAVFDPTTYALKATTVSGGGLVTGGGSLATNRTITVTAAAAADVRTGTSTARAMTPGDTYSAFAEVALTDVAGGTVAVDLGAFVNALLTFTGSANSRTLGNPTNPKVGQEGSIRLVQSGSGSNSLSFGGYWKRVGGAPTLSTAAGTNDVLVYKVITSTFILYDVMKAPS
jgi:hypothetical protein